MPDKRQHRGPHPEDHRWFSAATLPTLTAACRDLSWLLSRDYSLDASLKLVGDRYKLVKRQRDALTRASCSQTARERRLSACLAPGQLQSRRLAVDTFNCLIGVEVALSGGVILIGRDGAHRDLASVHGTYRRVQETEQSLDLIVDALIPLAPQDVIWFLDRPVSNSGRLAALLRDKISERELRWRVELVADADRAIVHAECDVAVSADSWILDHVQAWFDLTGHIVKQLPRPVWSLDLRDVEG